MKKITGRTRPFGVPPDDDPSMLIDAVPLRRTRLPDKLTRREPFGTYVPPDAPDDKPMRKNAR